MPQTAVAASGSQDPAHQELVTRPDEHQVQRPDRRSADRSRSQAAIDTPGSFLDVERRGERQVAILVAPHDTGLLDDTERERPRCAAGPQIDAARARRLGGESNASDKPIS